MNQCPICSRFGNPGLCSECLRNLNAMLRTIARLVPELDTELLRQTAKTSKMQRAGGSSHPLPYSPEASELTEYAIRILSHWLNVATNVDTTALNVVTLARTAYFHVRRLARVPAIRTLFNDLAILRDGLLKLTDLPIEHVFLGTCAACGVAMHGDPMAEYQVCNCGSQIGVQEAKKAVEDLVNDSWLTPKEIREYFKSKLKTTLSSQVLSNWGYQEKVLRKDGYYHLASVIAYAEVRGLLKPAKV